MLQREPSACAPPGPSIPQAQRASGIPGSHEDKTDDDQGKARTTETLELTESPAPAVTPRLGDAPGLQEYPLSL